MANFDLKPCPFCGGPARIENAGKGSYRVVCSGCGARSGRIFVKRWHSTKFVAQGQVAKLWNVRVPAAPELLDNLKKDLDEECDRPTAVCSDEAVADGCK